VLVNKGDGTFICQRLPGVDIKGQVRHIRKVNINKSEALLIVKNNDSTQVIRFNK
jgi:hypothetical protein